MGRIIALDIGDRRIGVAISDPLAVLAQPFTILERTSDEDTIETIVRLINSKEAEMIIVGLPLLFDNSEGEQAIKVRRFTNIIRKKTSIPLVFRDERLTTVIARLKLRETKKKKIAKSNLDDDAAAAVILQDYLDESNLNRVS
jgi:putative Holliday junction resolvase